MRLLIGICSARDIKPATFNCLLGLWTHIAGRGVLGKKPEAFTLRHRENCSILSTGRQNLVTEAAKRDATHLLFIDDDMTFPPNALDMLARHDKRVIGVNYRKKVPGNKAGLALRMSDKLPADSVAAKTGVEEVGRIGLGFLLIETQALAEIGAPHFAIRWNEAQGIYRSDDYALCDKLRTAGIPMWVEHELSLRCAHVGDYHYRLDGPE